MSHQKGIDVSKWQGEMDWRQAADAGAAFGFMRASSATTNGIPYKDYQFDRNSVEAPTHLLVGHYHFLRPVATAVAQADFFCDLIENVERPLPPVCDIEQAGPVAHVHAFVDRIYERLGVWPLIYTGVYIWKDNYENSFNRPLCDLWLARYQVPDPFWNNVTLKPWINKWTFWQYSADGNGLGAEYGAQSNSIDLNWFNGTYDELLAYADLEPEPEATLEERVAALELRVANLEGYHESG